MKIHIEIDTTMDSGVDLPALFAALAGRAVPLAPTVAVREPALVTEDPAALAERLIAHAEATRAAPPPPADEDDAPIPGLDASGVPWDERIHSSPASINAGDGMWRKRRKVDEVTFGRIHAELQHAQIAAGNLPNGGEATGTTATGTESLPVDSASERAAPPPPPEDEEPGNESNTDGANASTVGTSAPANAASAGCRFESFGSFVSSVSKITTPPIAYDELNSFAQLVGVAEGFRGMKDHADKWDAFYEAAGGK